MLIALPEAFEIELLDLMNKSGGLHLHQLTKQTGKPKTEINSVSVRTAWPVSSAFI